MTFPSNSLHHALSARYPLWQAPLPFSLISATQSGEISEAGAVGMLRIGETANCAMLNQQLSDYQQIHSRPSVCFMHRIPQYMHYTFTHHETLQHILNTIESPYTLSEPDHFLDLLDTVIATSPRLIGFACGIPEKDTIQFIKSQDILTFAVCRNVLEALVAIDFEIDILVLQGSEAGGEQCRFNNQLPEQSSSALSLLQQVRTHTNRPIILWGDFTHGADIVAAIISGAQGVMLDRIFVQCSATVEQQEKLQTATEYHFSIEDTLTIHPLRCLVKHNLPHEFYHLNEIEREALLTLYYQQFPEQIPICASTTTNTLPTQLNELLSTLEQQVSTYLN